MSHMNLVTSFSYCVSRGRKSIRVLSLEKFLVLCIQFLVWGGYNQFGTIKLQVSFAEYRLFYRSLLQKRPII